MPSVVGIHNGKLTLEEETIIIEHVRKQPHNLQLAFEAAAEELQENGRKTTSPQSISALYYSRLRGKYPAFTLEGRDQSLSNTKVVQKRSKIIYTVDSPTVAQLASQYNRLTSKQKQDFQVLIK